MPTHPFSVNSTAVSWGRSHSPPCGKGLPPPLRLTGHCLPPPSLAGGSRKVGRSNLTPGTPAQRTQAQDGAWVHVLHLQAEICEAGTYHGTRGFSALDEIRDRDPSAF